VTAKPAAPTPRTEAGRTLLEASHYKSLYLDWDDRQDAVDAILAIETEAAAESGAPRTPWVRYRLAKGKTVLTFRVPQGTPMVMEQAGWDLEGAVIEARAANHKHDPDACDECQEMVEEALRE